MPSKIEDGLTNYQRYCKRHPERVKAIQKRSRERKSREMTESELAEAKLKKAEYDREYRKNNREKRKVLADKWRKTEAFKKLYERNYKKRKIREGIPDRVPAPPPEVKRQRQAEKNKKYWLENKDRITKTALIYRKKNAKKIRAWQKEYDNQPHRKRITYKNKALYFKNNPQARVRRSCYRRIYDLLKERFGKARRFQVEQMIGCTRDEVIRWLESQFTGTMSWATYGNGEGKWTIDHREPLSHFDLLDEEQRRKAFHWSNMQPKMAVENSRKGNRFKEPALGQLPILALAPADLKV